jgi:hypothetical protein
VSEAACDLQLLQSRMMTMVVVGGWMDGRDAAVFSIDNSTRKGGGDDDRARHSPLPGPLPSRRVQLSMKASCSGPAGLWISLTLLLQKASITKAVLLLGEEYYVHTVTKEINALGPAKTIGL